MAVMGSVSSPRSHKGIAGIFSSFLEAFKCTQRGRQKARKPSSGSAENQEQVGTAEEHTEQRVIKKDADSLDFKWVVKQLRFGNTDQKERAASLIRKLTRETAAFRIEFAELGAIPLLVSVLQSESAAVKSQISSLLALLNLAIGNNRNKEWIVNAGVLPIIVGILSSNTSGMDLIDGSIAALLSLSALDSNKPVVGRSGAIPCIVRILSQADTSSIVSRDSIRVLYNLSICTENVGLLAEQRAHEVLLQLLSSVDTASAEKILAVLGHLVERSEHARKSFHSQKTVENFLTALKTYTAHLDSSSSSSCSSSSSSEGEYSPAVEYSRCQERALYVLMVVSHHSWEARQAMVTAGAVAVLLEVALLGTTIAQKRAVRILDCLRGDRFQRNGRPVSAPLDMIGRETQSGQGIEGDRCQERTAVNWMVKQSLQRNMEKMVRRARMDSMDLDSSKRRAMMMISSGGKVKSFSNSSSSKSLHM